jgi:hypothetical protein
MASSTSAFNNAKFEVDASREFLQKDLSQLTDNDFVKKIRKARDAKNDTEQKLWEQFRKIYREVGSKKDAVTMTVEDNIQARIERRVELMRVAKSIKDEGNKELSSNAISELQASHEAAMNPDTHPVAAGLNSLGFAWFLGASPAAGLVNMTQTPVVSLPVLAAKFGWRSASAEMATATIDFFRTKQFSVERSLKNAGEEAAFKYWYDQGLLDNTLTHDTQGSTQGSTNTN